MKRKMFSYRILILVLLFTCSLIIIGYANVSHLNHVQAISCYLPAKTLLDTIAEELDVLPQINDLVETDVLTPYDQYILTSNAPISFCDTLRILLPVFDIYPYPAEIAYPDFTPLQPLESPEALNVWATAVDYGIVSPQDNPNQATTVADFQKFLSYLHSHNFTPSLPIQTTCPYISPDAEWDITTFRGRNSLLSAWELIPDSWREDYMANSWQIVFTVTTPASNGEQFNDAAGFIDYAAQTINLGNEHPQVTLHEFTHYAAYRANWLTNRLTPTYTAEADIVEPFLGSYSQSNPREYLAEFVSYWLLNPDQQAELKRLAPETSYLTIELIEHFPELLSD